MVLNIVEAIQGEDADCAFDQPCKFGHRVEGHAVYCHNDRWADSPWKCRRSWYTGGDVKDEECPGFQPNEIFVGALFVPPVPGIPCGECKGMRIVKGDRETIETCGRCMGDGVEPHATPLSQYEQDTLEMGCEHTGKRPACGRPYIRIAENEGEAAMLGKMAEAHLISVRSLSFAKGICAYLIELTPKGDAVMRANWASQRAMTRG